MRHVKLLGLLILLIAFTLMPPLYQRAHELVGGTPVQAQRFNVVECTASVPVNVALGATTSLVAPVTARRIRVCGFVLTGGGATTLKFISGTGATCGTDTVDQTAALELGDNTSVAFGSGSGVVFDTILAERLCIVNSAAVQVSGLVAYTQTP